MVVFFGCSHRALGSSTGIRKQGNWLRVPVSVEIFPVVFAYTVVHTGRQPRAALLTLCNASCQPGSLATPFIARCTRAICSSRSAPSSAAPSVMSFLSKRSRASLFETTKNKPARGCGDGGRAAIVWPTRLGTCYRVDL